MAAKTGNQSTATQSKSKPLDDNYYKQQDNYSKMYHEAREKGDAAGMRNANDAMNQVRNQYGMAAQFANEDIATIAAKGQTASQGGGGGSGYSSGESGVIQIKGPDRVQLSAPEDYSAYIEEMNRAKQEATLNDLKAAYDKNTAALNRAKEEIAPVFQQARNQTAGDSERAKRQFATYAAASGLNNGSAGQAELSRQNTLQGNLNQLNTQEASKLVDLELQRSQAETDYNNAIVKAKADGDYALASQIYQEKVRVDDALRQMQIQQAQLDLQNWQANYTIGRDQVADSHNRQELQLKLDQWQAEQRQQANQAQQQAEQQTLDRQQQLDKKQQQEYENLMAAAQYYAKYGDLSGFEALGKDTSKMQAFLEEQKALEQAKLQAQASQKTGGSKSGSTSKKSSRSTKATSGAKAGSSSASSGIIDAMLSRGTQAKAYEYLVGLGLSQGKTDQLWSLYREENAKTQAAQTANQKGWIAVPGYGRLSRAEVDSMVRSGALLKVYNAKTGGYTYKKNPNQKRK